MQENQVAPKDESLPHKLDRSQELQTPVAEDGLNHVLSGTEIMSPEGEAKLRAAVRIQIQKPSTIWLDDLPHLTEADKRYLGFNTVFQSQANIVNFDKTHAERWFQIVEEEVESARADGYPLIPVDKKEWLETIEHELDHFREGVKRGIDVSKTTLGIAFGYIRQIADGKNMIGVEWRVAPAATESVDAFDQIAMWMAPKEPSHGDCVRALNTIRTKKDQLLSRPRESAVLIYKLLKATKMNLIDFTRFLNDA
jgi:hypothetical protein